MKKIIATIIGAALGASTLVGVTSPANAAPVTSTETDTPPAVMNIVMGKPAPAPRRGCRQFTRYGTADEMNISEDSLRATVEVALIATGRQCSKRRAIITQEQVGFWLKRGDNMCREGNDVILWADPTSFGTYDSRELSTKCYPELKKLKLTWNYPKGKGVARKGSSPQAKLSQCSSGDYGARIPRRTNPRGELDTLCMFG